MKCDAVTFFCICARLGIHKDYQNVIDISSSHLRKALLLTLKLGLHMNWFSLIKKFFRDVYCADLLHYDLVIIIG